VTVTGWKTGFLLRFAVNTTMKVDTRKCARSLGALFFPGQGVDVEISAI